MAIRFGREHLTYGQLDALADRLASELVNRGVRRDELVGLCAERSLEMYVALLAILKAGGAYVPLDPMLPPERLSYLLRDTRTRLVLVQESSHKLLEKAVLLANEAHPMARLALDFLVLTPDRSSPARDGGDKDAPRRPAAKDGPATISTGTPAHVADPLDLIYVMYTSGTTGRPKGVMIPHRGVVRLVVNPSYVTLTPEETLLQLAPLSFDASTFEIWGSLLNGACLLVYPPGPVDLHELAGFIQSQGVTTLWLTSALFHAMMETAPQALAGVRQLLAGGDVLAPARVRQFLEQPGHGDIINGYGPTENTTFTCCARFQQPDDVNPACSVPIGRPISGTYVRLLDADGRPVPIGAVGELFTGGDGLARGYLNAPELTAERFIADALEPRLGARLYRTGDLARWRPDGLLEFLGRRDNQVKIRGYRVELEEIEAALGGHPGVRAAAVLALPRDGGEDPSVDKLLVAFVVARDEGENQTTRMRLWLAERLPAYMVPSRFVRLSALPLTPSGKLDRPALVRASFGDQELAPPPALPRNETERRLAEIWRSILGQADVGVADHFLDLGGHSLHAAAAAARICREFKMAFALPEIFANPTIADLARAIESQRRVNHDDPIGRADRDRELPMSSGQQRMWVLHQILPDPATYNEPVVFRVTGEFSSERLRAALAVMVDRHEILRTGLAQNDERLVQRVVESSALAFRWRDIDLSGSPESLGSVVVAEARTGFDLAAAPLWRVTCFRLGPEDHVLVFVFHHSIVDEWTLRLFFRECESRYGGAPGDLGAGPLTMRPTAEEAAVDQPQIQYVDYSFWQQQWVELGRRSESPEAGSDKRAPAGEVRPDLREVGRSNRSGGDWHRQRAFWCAQLKNPPPAVEFAGAAGPEGGPAGGGAVHSFVLAGPLTRQLRALAQAEGTTLFTLLFTAYFVSLRQWSGRSDIIVATPFTERRRPELQETLGFFLNTVPIRFRAAGEMEFGTALRQLQELLLEIYRNAEFPFEEIVKVALEHHKRGDHPLHQLLFVVREQGIPTVNLGPAKAHPLAGFHTGTSKADLTLSIVAEGDNWLAQFEYSLDRFQPEPVALMAQEFTELLLRIVANPTSPLGALSSRPGDSTRATSALAPHCLTTRPADRAGSPSPPADRTRADPPIDDEVETRMARIWRSVLNVDRVGRDDDFFEVGGHSLLAARMFSRIESEFGVRLPLASLLRAPTIVSLAGLIRASGQVQRWESLVPIRPSGQRPPLFLVHAMGGNVVGFHALSQHLGDAQPVYGLQSVGLDGRTPPLRTVAEMARHYLSEVRAKWPDGPYHFAGLSLGGMIAYEMAQQLHAEGISGGALIILDSLPANAARLLPIGPRLTLGARVFVARLRPYLDQARRTPLKNWGELARRTSKDVTRRVQGYPDRPLVARCNLIAYNSYVPISYRGHVLLINATDHPPARRELYAKVWSRLVSHGLTRCEVPGDHLTMMREPNVAGVAERISACLAASHQ